MKRILLSWVSVMLAALYLLNSAGQAAAVGIAPIAENLEINTYTNVSTGGMLSAFDPDGGMLRFVITTKPVKGTIEIQEDGSFLYTPTENRKGRDYFGYKAIDSEGNESQEATVIIRILKQKKAISYADMRGRADEYAAVVLHESGLYTGKQICGVFCFEPDALVTRAEFLGMCMKLTGKAPVMGSYRTGYLDDAAIPAWQKAYASAAALHAVYEGLRTEEGTLFSGDDPISYAQAAAMLDHALELENVNYISEYEQMDMKLAQSCANMKAYDVIPEMISDEQLLNRSEAAKMLAAAYELLEKR